MSEFLKPQSPLQHKDGAYVYPLTTADQVILEDNSRLNVALENLAYVSETSEETAVAPLNADTLGGHPVEDFIRPKAGFIYPLAGSIVPSGFLLCDGAAYSRTDFPELFAAIGTVYGSGDGSTTFNVPNLQTRVPVGAGGEFTLGATGGETEHTLTVDEMPPHYHEIPWNLAGTDRRGTNNYTDSAGFNGNSEYYTDTRGGGAPHNNMQPYTVVNYIIATGKDTGMNVSEVILGVQALPLEIQYGGTGATDPKVARENLGITPVNIGAAPAIESTDYPGCYYRTVNGETEWLNPPMVEGVEYRTTERLNGECVYTKLLNISPSLITAQIMTLPHNISNLGMGLTINVNWYRASESTWRQFPSNYYSANEWDGQVFWIGATSVKLELGSSMLSAIKATDNTIYMTLKYTKTT